jgi:hypothetical protein
MKIILLANQNFRGNIPCELVKAADQFETALRRRRSMVKFDCFTFLDYASRGGALSVQKRVKNRDRVWIQTGYGALKRALRSKDCRVFAPENTLDLDLVQSNLLGPSGHLIKWPSRLTADRMVRRLLNAIVV